MLVIPLIEYSFYTSYRMADSWIMGLPVISEDAWTRVMRAPYQLALLFIPVMATVSHRLKADGKSTLLQASVLTVSVLSVWIFWFKDDNFHIELAMSESVDRMEWQTRLSNHIPSPMKGLTKHAPKASRTLQTVMR